MTGERSEEYGEIARHGVEEFVADNVIVIRNVLEAAKRRRTLETSNSPDLTPVRGDVWRNAAGHHRTQDAGVHAR